MKKIGLKITPELLDDLLIVEKYLDIDDKVECVSTDSDLLNNDDTIMKPVTIAPSNDGTKQSLNLEDSDPLDLKIVKKCRVNVRSFHIGKHVKKVNESPGLEINVTSKGRIFEFDQETDSIVDSNTLNEIVNEETTKTKQGNSSKKDNLPSKTECQLSVVQVVKDSLVGSESVTMAPNKLSLKKSPSLQSLSISSTSAIGVDDSDSDDDVLIIEETHVGNAELNLLFESKSNISLTSKSSSEISPTKDCKDSKSFENMLGNVNAEPEIVKINKKSVGKNIKNDATCSGKTSQISTIPKNKVKTKKLLKSEGSEPQCCVMPPKKSTLAFKIPKTKFKKSNVKSSEVPSLASRSLEIVNSDGQSISIKSFLDREEIVPEVCIESFTESKHKSKFESFYDGVTAIKNSTEKKCPEVSDQTEKLDLESEGWDGVKTVNTDDERKMLAQTQFQNPLCSDPGRNLSFHGFRRLADQTDLHPKINFGTFSISNGQLAPLPGSKRKGEKWESDQEDGVKKIRLSEFGILMKSVFFSKFNKKIGSRKASGTDLEDFRTYLGHFKAGQEETANFLSYYNSREELDVGQTEEVIDIENQFSTFNNYYGEAEDLFCKECKKRHKFCQ
eukprot:GFUD01021258.1.p1 GENE.GFUD01021258.1~~GFUD01021258.1.p1  ORF type:complete len:615 (+),score=167.92 GFUD01021258.1:325-2169(+)